MPVLLPDETGSAGGSRAGDRHGHSSSDTPTAGGTVTSSSCSTGGERREDRAGTTPRCPCAEGL
jgi:hypothetical protein